MGGVTTPGQIFVRPRRPIIAPLEEPSLARAIAHDLHDAHCERRRATGGDPITWDRLTDAGHERWIARANRLLDLIDDYEETHP